MTSHLSEAPMSPERQPPNEHRYGCFSRKPLGQPNPVMDGAKAVKLPHRMSKDCDYSTTSLGKADAGCTGCTWRGRVSAVLAYPVGSLGEAA